MTKFFRKLTLPVVREEVRRKNRRTPRLSIRLRRAVADGGRWPSTDERERLDAWINARPRLRAICQFRVQLAASMESRHTNRVSESMMRWVRTAEASVVDTLDGFALSMDANMARLSNRNCQRRFSVYPSLDWRRGPAPAAGPP